MNPLSSYSRCLLLQQLWYQLHSNGKHLISELSGFPMSTESSVRIDRNETFLPASKEQTDRGNKAGSIMRLGLTFVAHTTAEPSPKRAELFITNFRCARIRLASLLSPPKSAFIKCASAIVLEIRSHPRWPCHISYWLPLGQRTPQSTLKREVFTSEALAN